jgi:hypothetical protein
VEDLTAAAVTLADAKVNTFGPVYDAHLDRDLGTVEFGEASINLTEAVGEEAVCDFSGKVNGVARSSGSSGTAQMKDLVGPDDFELEFCKASPGIETTVRVSDTATLDDTWDPNGTINSTMTFSLYGPDVDAVPPLGANCGEGTVDALALVGTPFYVSPVATSTWIASNTWAATGFYELATGTYYWVVDYTGDDENDPDSSACGSEAVTIDYSFGD